MNKEFLNESMCCESIVTGEEVANMVGMADLYKKGKQMEANGLAMEEGVKSQFTDMLERMNRVPKNIDKDFD